MRPIPPFGIDLRRMNMITGEKIMRKRLAILRARRARARASRMNEANLIEQAGEDLWAAFHGRRAADNAAVEHARRELKNARVS